MYVKFGFCTENVGSLQLVLLAAPGETVKLAVLPPQERHTAVDVQCVAGGGAGVKADAYGDLDVQVFVKCTAKTCSCSAGSGAYNAQNEVR